MVHEVSSISLVRRLHSLIKSMEQVNVSKSLVGSLGSSIKHVDRSISWWRKWEARIAQCCICTARIAQGCI